MSDLAFRVEGLSKQYFLGEGSQRSTRNFREFLVNCWQGLFSKSPPTEKTANETEFWALEDVSFEIKKGDRGGIIGRFIGTPVFEF